MNNKIFCVSKDKKGLSEIVAVIIVILLVMSSGAIIWSVVNNLIKDKTDKISSCFDVDFSESVFFNNDYTCYDSSNDELQFSIGIGDFDIEKTLISVSYDGISKSFTLTNEGETIDGLVMYPSRDTNIYLPEKNGGKTYIALGIPSSPDWIKIIPYVDGKQCDVSDTVYSLYDCSSFG